MLERLLWIYGSDAPILPFEGIHEIDSNSRRAFVHI